MELCRYVEWWEVCTGFYSGSVSTLNRDVSPHVQSSTVQYSTIQYSTTLNRDVSRHEAECPAQYRGGHCARVRGGGGGASHGESICKHARLAARRIIAQWAPVQHSGQYCPDMSSHTLSHHHHQPTARR